VDDAATTPKLILEACAVATPADATGVYESEKVAPHDPVFAAYTVLAAATDGEGPRTGQSGEGKIIGQGIEVIDAGAYRSPPQAPLERFVERYVEDPGSPARAPRLENTDFGLSPHGIARPGLLIQCPDGQMKTITLQDARLSVGRSSAVELCFPEDAGLSRQHFAFEPQGDGWTVQDLGSKNGTFVNNIPLKAPLLLKPGDRVTAGHLVIVYSPAEASNAPGIVVFDGENDEITVSSVVTTLEGALSNQSMTLAETAVPGSGPMQELVRAGLQLSSNRPPTELFPVILDLAIESVHAQRGVLLLLENDELILRAHKGDGFRIPAAVRDRVLNQRASILVRDAQLDDAFKGRESTVEQKVHTMMAVPLQTKERIIGLIYVDSPFILRQFTKDDLSLLTVMANIAATRIENARLVEIEQAERIMKRDLVQAADIQGRLLPDKPPQIPNMDLAAYSTPCRQVGGDYYDFFPYLGGRLGMVIAGVSGKGACRAWSSPPGSTAE
jgi:sigma-B regulation protein RsbU (phosphoserine phosphatase)